MHHEDHYPHTHPNVDVSTHSLSRFPNAHQLLLDLFNILKYVFGTIGASIPMNQNGSLFQYLVSARANANEVQLLTFFSATDRVTKDKDFLSHDPDSTN
jgi:hypothetical protein